MLSVIMDGEEVLWSRSDSDLTLSLTRLLERGLERLTEVDTGGALVGPRLARACHLLVPQVSVGCRVRGVGRAHHWWV